MSDLIDLSSPDAKGVLGPKLASPLIPAPTNLENNETSTCSDTLKNISQTKTRESLENNPFDKVLHETTEYIRKKDDPFEVVLEKALKSDNRKSTPSRSCSVDVVGSCITSCQRRVRRSKLNRTLDESHTPHNISREECIFNLNKTEDFSKYNDDASFCDTQPGDLSILNQSAMNDTLLDRSCNNEEKQIKSIIQQRVSLCIQKGTLDAEKIAKPNATLKPSLHYRSLSQGASTSPRKVVEVNGRSHSIIDTLKVGVPSSGNSTASSLPSIVIDDVLNDGFLRNNSSCTSVFSILSNISGIRKVNSVSPSNCSSLSGLSDGTINRAFLTSYDSETSDSTKSTDKIDCIVENKSQIGHINSVSMIHGTPKTPSDISDVTHLLKKLKLTSPKQHYQENIPRLFVSNSVNESSNEIAVKKYQEDTLDKLLDTHNLIASRNCSRERNKSCASDWSSDSVFSEKDKTSKLILHEAKSLAEIFDDLAHKTESGSSTDELLSNNPSWKLELLPAFDDEPVVEDLILLPASPETSSNEDKHQNAYQRVNNINSDVLQQNHANLEQNAAKISKADSIDPIANSHKVNATALLLDLKKIVKSENNPEADQLLENLEKALGVKYKDNTELLMSCLESPNNLAKSPVKADGGVVTIENLKEEDINRTQDDNLNIDSVEVVEKVEQYDNITMNNLNTNEIIDKNEKSLATIASDKSENAFYGTNVILEDSPNEMHESTENIDNCTKSGDATRDSLSNSPCCDSGEKVALDLFDNLSKLLSGQCQEPTTLRLIKNLGTVLSLVSSNCNAEDYEETDQCSSKYVESPMRNKSKPECDERTSTLSKSISELTSKIKASAKKSPTRRMSLSQTTPTKIIQDTPVTTNRNKSQLKSVKKRFSSDPGFINSMCSKKGIDAGVLKNAEPIVKEVNSIGSHGEKSSTTIHTVKTKLKKKVESSLVSKKGPLKAVLPIGSMQRRGSIGKKTVSSEGSITPPNSKKKSPLPVFTVVTSTPDSLCSSESTGRKSPKTKPVASSTPDIESSRAQKIQSQTSQSSKKRSLICDISPVSTQENNCGNNGKIKDSPKRIVKVSSPKRTSFKARQSDNGPPKYFTSPSALKRNTCDNNSSQRRSEYGYRTTQDSQKGSPISLKRMNDKRQASPLRESNKIAPKMKAVNLASKLRRHSSGNNYIEKDHF